LRAKAEGHFGSKKPPSTARSFAVGPDGKVQRKRGRLRKIRPKEGDFEWIFEDIRRTGYRPSLRDLAAVFGCSRQKVSEMMDGAGILSEKEFEAVLDLLAGTQANPIRQLALLARGRAGKSAFYERRCPHCGNLLRVEGPSRKLMKYEADRLD
jgi:hypothetical protein